MDYYIFTPLLFILRIFEFCSQLTLSLTITNSKISIKKLCISSTCIAIIFEIFKLFIPQYLTSVLSAVVVISFIIFIFKTNYIKATAAYFITAITLAITDLVISTTIIKLTHVSTFAELSQSEHLMTIGRVAITLIIFLISLILKFIKQTPKEEAISNIQNRVSLVNLIITFLLLIPNLIMIIYYHDDKPLPLAVIIINIVAIISMFFISIFNTQRGIKLVQTEEELLTEKIYNKTQQELVDSLRTFKHDYKNVLQTIHGYIYIKDMDGLSQYFDEVLKEAKTITSLDSLNPELFGSPSLFSLVAAKMETARRNGVSLNLKLLAKLENLEISEFDFTRAIGILLDNAIEASSQSKRKFVNFSAYEENQKIKIEISNSFINKGLKVEELCEKGVSTKGKNRGLGLFKVKDILSKYPKISHEIIINGNDFTQRLIINKIKIPA